jgi:quinol monooxygenase YgiN
MPKEDVHAIAVLNARPDKTEELNSLLTTLLEPTRQESGCIQFDLLQNRETPREFAIVSR